MLGSGGGRFLLFAGGEPDRGDDGRRILRHFPRLRAFSILPPEHTEAAFVAANAAEARPWMFPIEVRSCIVLVQDLGLRLGRTVAVVDANRPAGEAAAVARWVRSDTRFPLLVSPSGRSLEGPESFTPGAVKRFLKQG